MVYDRNSRGGGGGQDRGDSPDYGRNYGGGRDYSYSSAREYRAAGGDDRGRDDYGRGDYGRGDGGRGDHGRGQGRFDQGGRSEGGMGYGSRESYGRQEGGRYDRSDYGARDYGQQRYGERDRQDGGREKADYYRSDERGRFGRSGGDRDRQSGGYGRQPQGYDYEDRGFFDRAGDEVRSWFGDEDAERRREMDQRYDERSGHVGRSDHDDDYRNWRSGQMAALDRDYDDYRRENRSRFEQEFSSWRTTRQGQRDQLKKVQEHQEVVGSDGAHVGTVDKIKGDRILLTKNDKDAGGRHHTIPCHWVTSVDDKVTLNKSADDAKQAWADEDRSGAMFDYGDKSRSGGGGGGDRDGGERSDRDGISTGRNLNKSFSGTY